MAELVLFHSALGLRPGVHAAADRLRAAGHKVHTPDLYDGEVFDVLPRGIAKRDALGIPEILRRAHAAVAPLKAELVYAGFSLGAAAAQMLAATRPGARGAVLMHAALPVDALGVSAWPAVPVQLHVGAKDPWVDPANVDALAASVRAAGVDCERYTYPASGHLFADPDLPDYDRESAELMWTRVLAFLAAR